MERDMKAQVADKTGTYTLRFHTKRMNTSRDKARPPLHGADFISHSGASLVLAPTLGESVKIKVPGNRLEIRCV